MFKFLLDEAPANTQGGINTGVYVIFLVGIVLLVVFPMLTQRRRNREYQAMIGSLNVGDLVKTAGGIIGKIQSISSKGELTTVVLETGSKTEKSYMEFDINMVACVLKSTKVATETVEETEDEENVETTEETETVEATETVAETPVEEPKVEETEQKVENTQEDNSAKKPASRKTSVKKSKK